MIFSVSALQHAIGQQLSAEVARRLPDALKAVRSRADAAIKSKTTGKSPAHQIPHNLIGETLIEALASGSSVVIASLPLSWVELHVGAEPQGALTAEDAAEHLLLSPWLPMTLGAAVSAPVIAGATMAHLTPNAPRWGMISIIERGDVGPRGVLSVEVTTSAGEGVAIAHYGAGAGDPGVITTHRIDARGLMLAGWSAASANNQPRPVGLTELEFEAVVPADSVRH